MPRPPSQWGEFIGQQEARDGLRKAVLGAQRLGRPVGHVLLEGPSGCGKTRLAKTAASEFGAELRTFHPETQDTAGLVSILEVSQPADFAFIDEAHLLDKAQQHLLYKVIDDQGGNGQHNRPTLVLATNLSGRLFPALRNRMQVRVSLGYYTVRDLRAIALRIAESVTVILTPQAATQLALASSGIAREVEHLIANVQENLAASACNLQLGPTRITEPDVARFLDERGFAVIKSDDEAYGWAISPFELRLLTTLGSLKRRGASRSRLCDLLQADEVRVREAEAILIRASLIETHNCGRVLSEKGRAWLRAHREDKEI